MIDVSLPALPDQEYFNIGEISRIAQVPEHTLRYWESRMRVLRPIRRESGHRRYTREDLRTILKIKKLIQERRMTLEGARKLLVAQRRPPKDGGETAAPSVPMSHLKALRDVREELRDLLDELK